MPDVETTQDQPSAASTDATPESSGEYIPSFARDDAEPESTAEATPETQTAGEEGEAESTAEGAEAEGEPAAEGEGAEPSQDEFLASLDPSEVAFYARRYPTLYNAYLDPNQPTDLRQLFVDTVNKDHAWAEQNRAEQGDDEEPTSEEPATAQPDVAKIRQEYYSQIDNIVSTQLDQTAVNELGANLLEALSVDMKSTDPEVQAIVKNAPKLGKVLARGAVDLMATVLPNLLQSRMEMAFPEITEMYYDNLRARTWESIRSQTLKNPEGAPYKPYAKLPAIGTDQWNVAVDKALAEMPELREMFANLPPKERFARQYRVAAKLMTGQRVDPVISAQAVETGKKLARKAAVQRTAGKALGAGRPTSGASGKPTGNEDIFGPGAQEYMRRGG